MTSEIARFDKPYEVRRKKGFLFWQWAVYIDGAILLSPFSYENARAICGWLNGACNLGRLHEITQQLISAQKRGPL